MDGQISCFHIVLAPLSYTVVLKYIVEYEYSDFHSAHSNGPYNKNENAFEVTGMVSKYMFHFHCNRVLQSTHSSTLDSNHLENVGLFIHVPIPHFPEIDLQ